MEKRELTRVSFNIEATVKYQNKTFRGKVENLSLKGIFIRTTEKIETQSKVDIIIHLAGESSDLEISLSGIVVRVSAVGVGIQFEKIDLDSFIHLRNIVSYNSGDEDKIMNEFFTFVNSRIKEDDNH